MPWRVLVVSVHLQLANSLLVTGMYLSNPQVPVSSPYYMPALVLFHCLLNSVSGSPGLLDCLVITGRRLFMSGFGVPWQLSNGVLLGLLSQGLSRRWLQHQDCAERQERGGKRWTAEDEWPTPQVFVIAFIPHHFVHRTLKREVCYTFCLVNMEFVAHSVQSGVQILPVESLERQETGCTSALTCSFSLFKKKLLSNFTHKVLFYFFKQFVTVWLIYLVGTSGCKKNKVRLYRSLWKNDYFSLDLSPQ